MLNTLQVFSEHLCFFSELCTQFISSLIDFLLFNYLIFLKYLRISPLLDVSMVEGRAEEGGSIRTKCVVKIAK